MKPLVSVLLVALVSSAVSPAELPTSIANLRLWLKADAGIMTEDNAKDGGTARDVVRWADQSGQGVELGPAYKGPATRPALIASVPELGGKPALRFDGKGGSKFEVTDALIGRFKEPFDLNRGTVFLVAKMSPVPTISPLTLSATADSKTGRGGVGIRRGEKMTAGSACTMAGRGTGRRSRATNRSSMRAFTSWPLSSTSTSPAWR